jgi:hypothetical protein
MHSIPENLRRVAREAELATADMERTPGPRSHNELLIGYRHLRRILEEIKKVEGQDVSE